MAPAVFPEKRTRSQLALPDEILQIPQGSPMKAAKSALKSQTHLNGASSSPRTQSEETDDELLLSPKKVAEEGRKPSSSKRSVSPQPHDEYSRTPRSPSKGRDPKRIKRDALSEPPEAEEVNIDFAKTLQQQLTPSHVRHQLDSNTTTARRSGRKRSSTTTKKPLSTVSASPPPTDYTPVVSPKKGRAQSVPLFPSNYDMPRIDFRNPPPSPKRGLSLSRSPGKEKFRIELGSFPKSTSLPTIQDETSTAMEVLEEATSVDEERELPTVTSESSIPTFQLDPATSESSIASKTSVTNLIPATPRTRLLDELIPMSPLTPVPETPFPGRKLHLENDRIQVDDNAGWGVNLINEFECSKLPFLKENVGNPTTESKSPLPKTVVLPKPSRNSSMPPPVVPNGPKKPIKGPATYVRQEAVAGPSNITAAPKPNAFDLMMKRPREATARMAEKAKQFGKGMSSKAPQAPRAAPLPPPSQQQPHLFSHSKGKERAVPVLGGGGSGGMLDKNMNLKRKMKKKKEAGKPTGIVLEADEEEEENAKVDDLRVPVPSGSKAQDEPPKLVEETDDTVMESPMEPDAPPPVPNEESLINEDVPMTENAESTPPSPLSLSQDTGTSLQGSSASLVEESSTNQRPSGFGPSVSMDNAMADQPDEIEGQPAKPSAEKVTTAASTKPGPNKLPLGKKHRSSVAPADRVTRSLSKRKDKVLEPSQLGLRKKGVTSGPLKSTSGTVKKFTSTKQQPAPVEVLPVEDEPLQPMETDPVEPESDFPPGSPMRTSSPAKTPTKGPAASKKLVQEDDDDDSTIFVNSGRLSLGRTPTKNKTFVKSVSTPSPTKIARATSLFTKPTLTSLTRTFSSDSSGPSSAAGASLSTLSNALEKLRMPPPSRPNTSLGFSHGVEDDEDGSKPASKDYAALNRTSTTLPKPDGLRRSVTVSGPYKKADMSSTSKNLVQKPLGMFMRVRGSAPDPSKATGRVGAGTSMKAVFGIGGPPRRTVSKKTSLPMVVGSPVKGGGGAADDNLIQESRDESGDSIVVGDNTANDSNIFMVPLNGSTDSLVLEELEGGDKGKGKEKSKNANASRRVSMLSHALSQSLSELPLAPVAPSTTNSKGLMGPPATPPSARLRAGSSNNATTSSGGEGTSSPSQAGPSGTRSSSRIATKNAQVKVASPDAPISADRKSTDSTAAPAPLKQETLKILNDCKIFVDVKTDDGDEAGSLFVEMLEGIGAKIMTRAGQTCTHIVYKNGLMSTVTRYKLLRDPKPLVVAIGWVVECVEQRKHVDEANFIIDLDEINMIGTHKRRRSILPKLFADLGPEAPTPIDTSDASGEADQSMDGSTSSITLEDDMALAPLERARRRKSMVAGRP
ncbi:hypothetical protein CPB83DRAFT_857564 [Crepidotus variabilis]|uniref:BRCT domain-containing protein n=1 Tax=Crepidotus variabilis TaxID=179855 RepID=A0A9P6ECU4_9AGAR|nr:hypothetical protein CPB83DRAFT_857564 [Crepidotus variabilis]